MSNLNNTFRANHPLISWTTLDARLINKNHFLLWTSGSLKNQLKITLCPKGFLFLSLSQHLILPCSRPLRLLLMSRTLMCWYSLSSSCNTSSCFRTDSCWNSPRSTCNGHQAAYTKSLGSFQNLFQSDWKSLFWYGRISLSSLVLFNIRNTLPSLRAGREN